MCRHAARCCLCRECLLPGCPTVPHDPCTMPAGSDHRACSVCSWQLGVDFSLGHYLVTSADVVLRHEIQDLDLQRSKRMLYLSPFFLISISAAPQGSSVLASCRHYESTGQWWGRPAPWACFSGTFHSRAAFATVRISELAVCSKPLLRCEGPSCEILKVPSPALLWVQDILSVQNPSRGCGGRSHKNCIS